VQQGTTSEANLLDYFRTNKIRFEGVVLPTLDETIKAYEAGRCKALTTDSSQLYVLRLKLNAPNDHMVLPEVISKEPLSPVVRQDDMVWFNIVKWTVNALINAEELGITKDNIDEQMKSRNPAVKRLLGTEGDFGTPLGLTKDWAARAIKAGGNYEEIFERNLGMGSSLKIQRGLNNLWNKGGLIYAPPFR
jgi:general L-amino acid transport system substrate-binding protein